MFKKVKRFVDVEGIETRTQSNRGGSASSPSGSTAAQLVLRRTLVDTKWLALSGAFTGSNLNGFTHSGGILTCTDTTSKNYFIYGQVSVRSDVDTDLRMAFVKNGAIVSGSEVISTVRSGSWQGSITPTTQLVSSTRMTLTNTNTVGIQLICDTTGSNVWAKTAHLIAQQ